jgi:tRNA 2-selenouridine synthase
VTAREVLQRVKRAKVDSQDCDFIDVRSQAEFQDSALPGFRNSPILNDGERHEVGLTYKNQGQDAAIEKGVKLTLPHKEARIDDWMDPKRPSHKIVACWRGGLRSKTACNWIEEAKASLKKGQQLEITQVRGGTKAMRGELLIEFETLSKREPFLILSGKTGSGKTSLFHALAKKKPSSVFLPIDLENLANHKGSTFGRPWKDVQPAQTVFENRIGIELFEEQRRILVEDESICIGSIHLPQKFKQKMTESEAILVETPIQERCELLSKEYVDLPLSQGVSPEELHSKLREDLIRLRKRLGGLQTEITLKKLSQAFNSHELRAHSEWIHDLLVHYYDRMYEYGFNRQNRKTLFRGDRNSVLEFLQNL